jgi:GNAT superfamily N-acetyltransferase
MPVSGLIIRLATVEDAPAVSRLVVRTLEGVNIQDYGPVLIAQIARNFTPDRMAALIGSRQVFAAIHRDIVVGTAALDGATVRTVFVAAEIHGQGVGRALMAHVEAVARANGVATLTVPSSITAEGFYARIGYRKLREVQEGPERVIIMERALTAREG